MTTIRGNDFIIVRYKIDEDLLARRKASGIRTLVKKILEQHVEVLLFEMTSRNWDIGEIGTEFALQVKKKGT